jgi:hypothetical protein
VTACIALRLLSNNEFELTQVTSFRSSLGSREDLLLEGGWFRKARQLLYLRQA